VRISELILSLSELLLRHLGGIVTERLLGSGAPTGWSNSVEDGDSFDPDLQHHITHGRDQCGQWRSLAPEVTQPHVRLGVLDMFRFIWVLFLRQGLAV
jgi:hypothetical protein